MKLSTWTPAKQIRYIDAGGWIFGPSFAAIKEAYSETMTTAGAAPFEPPPLLSGPAARLTVTDVVIASRNARLLLDEAGAPFFADNHAIQLLRLPKDAALFKAGPFAYLVGGIAAIRSFPGEIPAIVSHVPAPTPAAAVPTAIATKKAAKVTTAKSPSPETPRPQPGPDLRTIFRQAKALIGGSDFRPARGILFENERVTFTDLDQTVSLRIPKLKIEEPLAVDVLELDKLKLPRTFSCEPDGEFIQIRGGSFVAKVLTIPIEDLPKYPVPPSARDAVSINIPGLLNAAKRVLHATEPSGTMREQLHSLGIDTHCAGTDGHRLAVVPFENGPTQPSWTLPADVLPLLHWPQGTAKLIPPAELHQWLLWEDGSWMRLGYHRFPDWRKVVTPGGEQIRIHFSREEALGALESVGKEKDCSLLLSSQSVTVKAGNVTAAFEATVTQRPSDLREGSCEPIEVRMNPKLLVQALKAAETETLDVEMDWVGKQPSLMRFSSGDLFQVLMPLRR